MGPSANAELKAFVAMSDKELSDYTDLWRQKHELARNQANKELKQLRKETDIEIRGLLVDLTKAMKTET